MGHTGSYARLGGAAYMFSMPTCGTCTPITPARPSASNVLQLPQLQVRETVRDVVFLHNETFWAAAQKKYVYIYDKRGLEVHCLRDHGQVNCLDFLPHHFLLTSVGEHGAWGAWGSV